MTSPHLLETHLLQASDASGRPARELPPELLADATRRLNILALVTGGVWVAVLLLAHVIGPALGVAMHHLARWNPVSDGVAAAAVLSSAALWWYTRQPWCCPTKAMNVALLYEVFIAACIGFTNNWIPPARLEGLSWICVVLLVFPAILPNQPGRVLGVSLVAASMDPLAYWVAGLRGLAVPSAAEVLWLHAPNYICAVLAVVPARVYLRLGRQVSRARELGSYRLVERIGTGGMGEVWRATHRLLARPAAIKLIKTDLLAGDPGAGRALIQRFRREAEASAWLQSPHSIRLYDFGASRDGTFYFVMELLDGIDLERLVREHGPQPPERVAHLLRQASLSLAEAHARGIVHRDVKPANIFTCRMGLDYDFVKVLDFGLVKLDTEKGSVMDTMRRRVDVTTGTPAYMAPEMAANEPVDHRADLYALGCVGYWLLTGKLVFEAESPLQMLIRHLQAAPVPPSIRLGSPLPSDLEQLVLDCLAKRPDDRPASADAFRRRLDQCRIPDRWTEDRARDWWERYRPPTSAPIPSAPTSEPVDLAVAGG